MRQKEEYQECLVEHEVISSLLPTLPNPEEIEEMARLFYVFSDVTRLKIISALNNKEMCVCDLANLLGMKQPSISQHLKILFVSKVIKKRKLGLQVFYKLDDLHIEEIYRKGFEHVRE